MTRRQCPHGRRGDRCRGCGKGYCLEHGRPDGVLRQHCPECRFPARLKEALAVVRDCLMQAPDVQKCVLTLRTGTTLVLNLARAPAS